MLRFRFLLAAPLLLAITAAGEQAAVPWKVPPLDGELAGDFLPLKTPGAPSVHWTMRVRTTKPRERAVALTLDGPGLKLSADAQLDPAGEGSWRIGAADVDLGQWLPLVATMLPMDSGGMSVSGRAVLTGEGTWRGNILAGSAKLVLSEGRVEDPAHKLVVEGVALTLAIEDIAARRSQPRQVLTWRSGKYDTIAIGAGRAVFAIVGDELRIDEATVGVLGGELTIGAVVMSTQRPDLSVTAQVRGVDVTQLLFLLPPVLRDAKGRLDGHLSLRRDANGLQIGTGRLGLREGETAELRLAPTPGLLSASLPATVLQHYPGLGKIELGEVPLRADLLEVTFTPEGDQEGRTAWVHVAGGPVDPKLRAPIDLNVNVRGPLESLVRFGTNSRLRFGGANK